MYIRIYADMYICIHVYMYLCIYVHMYRTNDGDVTATKSIATAATAIYTYTQCLPLVTVNCHQSVSLCLCFFASLILAKSEIHTDMFTEDN